MESLSPTHENLILSEGKFHRIVGIDEVGRGCWAGPVHVGAFVYEPTTSVHENINDSKKITYKKRLELSSKLKQTEHLVLSAEPEDIDNLGIAKVIEHLMAKAVEHFNDGSTYFLIDGIFTRNFGDFTKKVIKGDSTYYSIAAASIIAKVERDKLMEEISENYPNYNFAKNKGYGTKDHIEALRNFGYCNIHRKSYKPIKLIINENISINN